MSDEHAAPLTTGEVAALFGVTPVTVAGWAAAGKLPFFRTPGGHRRFLRSDIAKLIEADVEDQHADTDPAEAVS